MKCIVLAGGSGDSLWPLSRRHFPKQFMNIHEGRSMLQETVVRNMPFCDEFIIVTNENYRNIVSGQMKAFQSMKYRIILEGTAKGTAAAIVLGSLFVNPSEPVLVVNSDNMISGEGYKEAILAAKEYAKSGYITALGVKPVKQTELYGYILREESDVKQFIARINFNNNESEGLLSYGYEDGYLWNCGILVFRAGDLTNAVRLHAPELYSACRIAKRKIHAIRRTIRFAENIMEPIPHGSIERLVLEKCDSIKVVEVSFDWTDIGNTGNIENFINSEYSENIIKNCCDNVSVINGTSRQLVVVNDIKDIVVVNTDDAVYVSSKNSAENIKQVMKDNLDDYRMFFDYNRVAYKEWGMYEILNYSNGYKVRKITVFPGMAMALHQHELKTEYWSVVEGVATVTIGTETKDYDRFENICIPVGVKHKLANKTDKNIVVIEVAVGESISDNDMVKIHNQESGYSSYIRTDSSPIVRLEPAFKDNLWGGNKIRTIYGKQCDYDVIAESWELSAHPDGQSRIASGGYKGMLFNDYLNIIGRESLGWKCQEYDRFPILIKFIDAKNDLSIQIHPDDEYALEVEDEYGKNEMWYVIDNEPGACLYCGLSRDASKEEIEERIKNNTITEILNKVEVKPGDVVMVTAGTIHAIGAGIFICEIQQNSNSTYRMYDYDRRDKFGNPRELHIQKALDVVDTKAYTKSNKTRAVLAQNEHYTEERLVQCKYFESFKFDIFDEATIPVNEASFVSIVVIRGEGTINADDYDDVMTFKAGESFFVNAGKRNITITGKAEIIVTRV